MFDCIWLSSDMFRKFGIVWFSYVWASLANFGQVWLCLTKYDYVWPYMTKFDLFWPSLDKLKIIQNHLDYQYEKFNILIKPFDTLTKIRRQQKQKSDLWKHKKGGINSYLSFIHLGTLVFNWFIYFAFSIWLNEIQSFSVRDPQNIL